MTQNTHGSFDDLIHPRPRLMVCSALAAVSEMRFDVLAKTVQMNAPALSKHLAKLTEAGYISSRPDPKDSRRTWISLTAAGHAAYTGHVKALQELAK